MNAEGFESHAAPQPPRGRLFRKYAAFFACLVGGGLLASGFIETYLFYQQYRDALGIVQREKARAAAAEIKQFMQEIERQIGWVTHAPWDPSDAGLEQQRLEYLRLLRQAPAITELRELDPWGKERLRVSRLAMDVLGSGSDFSRQPVFVETKAEKTYFSPVYFRKESAEPYVTIAMRGSADPAAVAVAEVNLRFILEVISQIRVGKAGRAYVLDAAGELVAHPDIGLVLRRTNLSSLPQVEAARAAARQPGNRQETVVARDLHGRQVLAAHAAVPFLGWLVFVEQPLEEAYAPLYSSVMWMGGVLLAGLALSIVGSLILTRKMVNPIRALQTGAGRIGAADLGYRIHVRTGDELEALADQFNRMAGQLQESYANLEHKVAARTQELTRALEELRALADVSRAVSSTLDLETVLTRIVSHAVQLTTADGGAIYQYDESAKEFHLRVGFRMEDELIQAFKAYPIRLGEGAVGRAAATRQPVQIADILEESDYEERLRDLLGRHGLRALLAVPLVREDQIVGSLVVRRKSSGEFPPEVVDLLKTFAAQSVLAIQNARLFREIADKGRQLESASRHKSEFLANMSHELRTPLNAIVGYTKLILNNIYGEVPDKIRDVMGRVDQSSRHLLGLINEVLDLSKIEAGQLALFLTDYSMNEVVQTVFMAMESLAEEKKLALKVTIATDLPLGRGDQRRITQVLLNLVGNAIKFTEVGEVRVQATVSDDSFVVSVSDTGLGIASADQQKIFEEFQQVDSSSTRKKGGTGLGLSIAKRIIEMHGGRIWLESSAGGGSTFWFSLPVRVRRQTERT